MTTQAFEFAMKAMDVLGDADLIVAPQTPTNHMCRAGAEIGGVDPFTAKRIYGAMLAAALEHLAEG